GRAAICPNNLGTGRPGDRARMVCETALPVARIEVVYDLLELLRLERGYDLAPLASPPDFPRPPPETLRVNCGRTRCLIVPAPAPGGQGVGAARMGGQNQDSRGRRGHDRLLALSRRRSRAAGGPAGRTAGRGGPEGPREERPGAAQERGARCVGSRAVGELTN